MPVKPILAIDQGTTSTRAIVFDAGAAEPLAMAQEALPQIFPAPGWVEHDPEAIWRTTCAVSRAALDKAGVDSADVLAIGITNQRETSILWNRETGRPVYNAVVWQDRRTAERCRRLVADGHEAAVQAKSGLVIDAYFSATKIGWILDHTDNRRAAARGDLAFGTVDSFLLWRLTGGRVHATDATNAARTGLMNIHTGDWDPELLDIFDVPPALLPSIFDTTADYGTCEPALFGAAIPIAAMVGDQQAALVGQACFEPGMVKSTYGTGCFMIANTGIHPVTSHNRLLTTIGYRVDGKTTYALEGSIFVAGAAIQWLRDGLGLIRDAADTAALAASVPDAGGVTFVPALTGLGAPHWDPDARGLICGLDRGVTAAHLVRAALEAVSFQTRDLIDAMQRDGATAIATLRVDGGMAANEWLLQNMADTIGAPVERAAFLETTALGAALLAGLQVGVYASLEDTANGRGSGGAFHPRLQPGRSGALYAAWRDAVRRSSSTGAHKA